MQNLHNTQRMLRRLDETTITNYAGSKIHATPTEITYK